jgi:hypothetical protein
MRLSISEKSKGVAQDIREYFRNFTKEEIEQILREAKDEVREYALDLLRDATPVDSGFTQASWTSVTRQGGLSFSFVNPSPAFRYLEYGEYKRHATPKTIVMPNGIFSSQAPYGIVGPLIEDGSLGDGLADLYLDLILEKLLAKMAGR